MRNRINRLFQGGTVVPLCAISHISSQVAAERQMIAALCAYLSARPDARGGLDDERRVSALVRDLKQSKLGVREEHLGVRRATIEVITALRALDYQHPLNGRPLPGDGLPRLDEVMARLMDHLAQSPYARDGHIDEADARTIARREYLDVEPWPFSALTSDPRS